MSYDQRLADTETALTAAMQRAEQAEALNAELAAALRELLADIPEPHAQRRSYMEVFIPPDVVRRARAALARLDAADKSHP